MGSGACDPKLICKTWQRNGFTGFGNEFARVQACNLCFLWQTSLPLY